jgi:hypothetical protein
MSKWLRMMGLVVLCGVASLSSGCMGLKLFSSDHTHYHGGAELREKVEGIEKRLDALTERRPSLPQQPN